MPQVVVESRVTTSTTGLMASKTLPNDVEEECNMSKKPKEPIQVFAELEYEISKYKVPPPKPWPWAINSDKTTNMSLRNLQMLEFLADLRKKHGVK